MKLKTLEKKGKKATIQDFISYFKGIPAERWCKYFFNGGGGKCCARGHLGKIRRSIPNILDNRLLELAPKVAEYNNGYSESIIDTAKNNPKTRVLNYLKSLLEPGFGVFKEKDGVTYQKEFRAEWDD